MSVSPLMDDVPPDPGQVQTSGTFTERLSLCPDLVRELDRRQVADRAVRLEAFSTGFPGRMNCNCTPWR
jgi:hypothetical protein